MAGGIYQIENHINGNRYIGSAVNLRRRWRGHLSDLRLTRHHNPHLQRAFAKYGETAFVFSVLEPVADAAQLVPREQWYLDTRNPEYNIARVAGSSLGLRRTEETRRKNSEAHMGQRPWNLGKTTSPETRKKISEALKGQRPPNYAQRGRRPSPETRAKMSMAQRRRWLSPVTPETRARISAAWTPERRQAMSDRLRGKPLTEEHKQRIGAANRGKRRVFSPETRAKMGVAQRARWRRERGQCTL